MFFFEGEGFSCSSASFMEALGISNAIFDQKNEFFGSAVNFFQFLVMKKYRTLDPDWIRTGIQPKMLDPYPDSMIPDSKHWLTITTR